MDVNCQKDIQEGYSRGMFKALKRSRISNNASKPLAQKSLLTAAKVDDFAVGLVIWR